jgi:RNA polymerase sigma factor (sigma-70 family)
MRPGGLKRVLDHLRPANGGGLTDAQLLARFIDSREEAAFAALVRRHGRMVLGVCRRILGHAQDAEDAFQATFLVLARKATSVVKREALASFLYGVAYRTALQARAAAVRRRARERQVVEMPHPEAPPQEQQEWRPVLDRELNALPDRYKGPVVLCDLEGKTRREAARQLGLSEGTLSSRLARARRLLAKRLSRQGVSLSGGALAGLLYEGAASAAVPAQLASSTVKAAVLLAAGQAAAATPAALLMNEVLKAMLMTKLKFTLAAVMMAALLGAGGLLYRAAGQAPRPDQAGNRPLSELELLRREVEILKLQMEVVQAELRILKGRGAAGTRPPRMPRPAGPTVMPPGLPAPTAKPPVTVPGNLLVPPAPAIPPPEDVPNAGVPAPVAPAPPAPVPAEAVPAPGERAPVAAPGPTPGEPAPVQGQNAAASPDQEVEAALKAFRKALDSGDAAAMRRAAAALEKALKTLRQQLQPTNRGQQ